MLIAYDTLDILTLLHGYWLGEPTADPRRCMDVWMGMTSALAGRRVSIAWPRAADALKPLILRDHPQLALESLPPLPEPLLNIHLSMPPERLEAWRRWQQAVRARVGSTVRIRTYPEVEWAQPGEVEDSFVCRVDGVERRFIVTPSGEDA